MEVEHLGGCCSNPERNEGADRAEDRAGEAMQWSDAGCSLKTDAAGHAYRLDVIVRERAKPRTRRSLRSGTGKRVSQPPLL